MQDTGMESMDRVMMTLIVGVLVSGTMLGVVSCLDSYDRRLCVVAALRANVAAQTAAEVCK